MKEKNIDMEKELEFLIKTLEGSEKEIRFEKNKFLISHGNNLEMCYKLFINNVMVYVSNSVIGENWSEKHADLKVAKDIIRCFLLIKAPDWREATVDLHRR